MPPAQADQKNLILKKRHGYHVWQWLQPVAAITKEDAVDTLNKF